MLATATAIAIAVAVANPFAIALCFCFSKRHGGPPSFLYFPEDIGPSPRDFVRAGAGAGAVVVVLIQLGAANNNTREERVDDRRPTPCVRSSLQSGLLTQWA